LKFDEKIVPLTHSCNIEKPWCKKCPKCLYVWMNFIAYLDEELIDQMFEKNLYDEETNEKIFLEITGL